MDREVLLTGIGGQGVQLAAKTLAVAAVHDGLSAMLFGTYGGSMRGGRTDATVVVSDDAVGSPPTVSRAWYAIGLHHMYWDDVRSRLRPGGLAIVDADVFRGAPGEGVLGVHATTVASDAGAPRAAAMAALGALAAATGLVSLDALRTATAEVLPPYRAQHAQTNARALEAGFGVIPGVTMPAWPQRSEVSV
ncbi:MAG TPA: 2-oxoacid:acceptor oxidoreductase family protein [Mycobacteriales bacterium]|jgi:Pyruvate/2-oxoacid:ferredoxin oxidoreductase gamma subunit|nr:2-oxoacid:acceptor oxidoreductase family protein [Mycobacteriales bacterium]